jgi:hypothetical protein
MKKLPKQFFVKIKHNLIMANSSPKLQGTFYFQKKFQHKQSPKGKNYPNPVTLH